MHACKHAMLNVKTHVKVVALTTAKITVLVVARIHVPLMAVIQHAHLPVKISVLDVLAIARQIVLLHVILLQHSSQIIQQIHEKIHIFKY